VLGFAFTELLKFRLLPRLKNIGSIRLYRPYDTPPGWPALGSSLTRPIRWDLIAQQYDQMVKYATARTSTRAAPSTWTWTSVSTWGQALLCLAPTSRRTPTDQDRARRDDDQGGGQLLLPGSGVSMATGPERSMAR
jgi:hypothetical protein